MKMPKAVQPSPARKAMNGTASIPHAGSSPKKNPITIGKHPKNAARAAIHRDSAGTGTAVSTGAARIASYVRWNLSLTNVPNIAGTADENGAAVATVPVATNST